MNHAMKQMGRSKTVLMLLIGMIILGAASVYTAYASEINDAKNEKSSLEEKKKKTEDRIKELEKEKGNIVKYIEKMDIQLNELNAEIESLTKRIDKSKISLKRTKEKLEDAKEQEKNQYETMKKRIKYMYENGNTTYIELILGASDMSDMLNRAEYIEKIMTYDKQMLSRYQDTKREIEETKKEVEEKIAYLEELNEEVSFEKATVETLIDKKSKEVKKYNATIKESKDTASEYANAIAEQEKLIEKLLEEERRRFEEAEKRRKEEEERKKREEAEKNQQNHNASNNSNSNTVGSTTGFIWPLPSSHIITSPFGFRVSPTPGASSYHEGIDIGAPTGSTIVASNAGTVVTASYSVGAGNYIMIAHGNGIYTIYMHCSKLLVFSGQKVSKGQHIGLVGSTGYSTGPHLHFGVSVNGKYVDPMSYLR